MASGVGIGMRVRLGSRRCLFCPCDGLCCSDIGRRKPRCPGAPSGGWHLWPVKAQVRPQVGVVGVILPAVASVCRLIVPKEAVGEGQDDGGDDEREHWREGHYDVLARRGAPRSGAQVVNGPGDELVAWVGGAVVGIIVLLGGCRSMGCGVDLCACGSGHP